MTLIHMQALDHFLLMLTDMLTDKMNYDDFMLVLES